MAGGSEIPIPPLAPKPSQGESFPFELTHLGLRALVSPSSGYWKLRHIKNGVGDGPTASQPESGKQDEVDVRKERKGGNHN
ncbi:unnamed protein product [Clonostachys rhizophaga]|uniref:Uncharacterized protein n=1 Tax=Clonostachys rhizophaga TaxID=160324 RepID=A0A9N9Y9S9_9HYPO|nr:unnamed protein product [Clonostachys rhizophaga]